MSPANARSRLKRLTVVAAVVHNVAVLNVASFCIYAQPVSRMLHVRLENQLTFKPAPDTVSVFVLSCSGMLTHVARIATCPVHIATPVDSLGEPIDFPRAVRWGKQHTSGTPSLLQKRGR